MPECSLYVLSPTHRWIGVAERPQIDTRKIRLADLDDVLPEGEPRVTPEERREEVAARQRQAAWRK